MNIRIWHFDDIFDLNPDSIPLSSTPKEKVEWESKKKAKSLIEILADTKMNEQEQIEWIQKHIEDPLSFTELKQKTNNF